MPTEDPMALYTPASSEFLQDHAFFVQPSSATGSGTSASLQSRVTSLEAEVSQLHEQLGKAKGVNDVMWETVVQKVIASGKEKRAATVGGANDDDELARTRKRGRV